MQRSSLALTLLIVTNVKASDMFASGAMRKENRTHQTAMVAIASSAGMVAAKVKRHEAPMLVDQADLTCGTQCTWNVQISTSKAQLAKQANGITYKTMQLKACQDESFHFDGCSTEGEAATICINSEKAPLGVRLLKNSKSNVVAYGSCCSPGQTDSIVQTNTLFCGASSTKEVPASTLPFQTSTAAPQATTIAAEGLPTDGPTSVWQGLLDEVKAYKYRALVATCVTMGAMAIICSFSLVFSHIKTGYRLAGERNTPHPSMLGIISLLWAVPVFAVLGIMGVAMPELAAMWQFLGALTMVAHLRQMPDMLIKAAGGHLQLQRGLQALNDVDRVHAFSNTPFCCLARFIPAKKPELADVTDLKFVISVICVLLPVLSFMEMFCCLEATLATVAAPYFATAAPSVATFVRCMLVFLLCVAMSSLRGLETLLEKLSPRAHEDMKMRQKQGYFQFLLTGVRLPPLVWHLIQSFVAAYMGSVDARMNDIGRSLLTCTAAFFCSIFAVRAFPTDDKHYPSPSRSSTANAAASATDPLKPVLDAVKYCPFCGSSDLELENNDATNSSESASCPQCSARHVPLHLVVHRGNGANVPSKVAKASPAAAKI